MNELLASMHTDTSYSYRDQKEVHFFSLIVAFILFLGYQLGRAGTGDAVNLNPLLLSASVILLPQVLRTFFKRSTAILQILVLLFFFVLGWICILLCIRAAIVLYTIFLVTAIAFFRHGVFPSDERAAPKIVLFVFMGLALIYLVWMQDYMNPLAPEAFTAAIRYSHVDTLFHAALTANIKTYGIASLGLEGLQPITYHSGSHYLFASYSQLCDVSVLEFYNFAYPVIFVPLFVQWLLFASYANLRGKSHSFRLTTSLVILFIVLTGFYPSTFGARYLLPSATNTHFMSASYNVSLMLMFVAICIYAPLFRKDTQGAYAHVSSFLIWCIPGWFFIIGYIKISTALVLFAVFLYLVVRKGLFRDKWISIAAIASGLLLYFAVELTVPTGDSTFQIQFGSFYEVFVNGDVSVYFLLQYSYFLLLLFIMYVLLRKRESHFFKSLYQGKYIVFELILVAAFVGILPGLLIYIDGGSAYYFSDIQYWLTVIALVHYFPYLIYHLYSRRSALRVPFRIALFVLIVLITREAVFRSFYYFIKKNRQVRTALTASNVSNGDTNSRQSRQDFFSRLSESPAYREKLKLLNLELFTSLRALPETLRSRAAIFCEDPQQLKLFLRCSEATFFIPAMSEMAMINGLFWRDTCHTIDAYGMKDYAGLPAHLSKDEARVLAKKNGFEFMIVINLKNGTFSKVTL